MSRWNLSQPPLAAGRKAPERAAFNRIVIAGQPTVFAGSSDAPLILEAGDGVTLTADQDNDTVRIDAAGGAGGSPLLHQASVTLTDAQIKAIPQSLTEPIPAPGANRITMPQSVFMSSDYAVTYDAAPGDDNIQFAYFPDGTTPINAGAFGTVNVTGGYFNWLLAAQMNGENVWITNMPIRILNFNGADFTGGDASNTLLINIPFMVFDFTTGGYLTVSESGWDEETRTFS